MLGPVHTRVTKALFKASAAPTKMHLLPHQGSRPLSTLLSPRTVRLRPRFAPSQLATIRHIHARAISYTAIPKFVARAFRVPVAGATVGAGALGYVNYKFEGTHKSLLQMTQNLTVPRGAQAVAGLGGHRQGHRDRLLRLCR